MAPYIKKLNLNYLKSIIALANRPDLFELVECGLEGRLLAKACIVDGVPGAQQKVYQPLDVGDNLFLGGTLDLADDVTIQGDLDFAGSAGNGMIQGEIYTYNVASVITSVNQFDWDQIIAFDTNGLSNLTTPDHTQNHIVIQKAGRYKLYGSWAGFGPGNAHDWDWHFKLNNGTVSITNSVLHFRTPAARNHVGGSWSCCYQLAVGDTVEVWVERYSAGNNIDLETISCTLGVLQIGA